MQSKDIIRLRHIIDEAGEAWARCQILINTLVEVGRRSLVLQF